MAGSFDNLDSILHDWRKEKVPWKTSWRGCEQVREAGGRKNKPLPFLENDSEKILSRNSSKATEHKIGLEISFFKVINHFKKSSKEDVYESYFFDNCRSSRALIG